MILEKENHEKSAEFLEKVKSIVGENNILIEEPMLTPFKENVTAFNRRIKGVIYPRSILEVQLIVLQANTNKVSLYPISQGKNWGYGSRLPVTNDCFIINFSRHLRKIHEVDESAGFATIEPGVTQGELVDFLKNRHSKYFLDVTGAGRDASILGNLLDGGVGMFHTRAEKLLSLQLILGNGELITTHEKFSSEYKGYYYPFGAGPDLRGLFIHSNFGIATLATIQLQIIPKRSGAFFFCLQEKEKLEEVVRHVEVLKQKNLILGIPRVFDGKKLEISFLPFLFSSRSKDEEDNSWKVLSFIGGEKKAYAETKSILKKELGKFGKIIFINKKKYLFTKRLFEIFKFKKLKPMIDFLEFFQEPGFPSNKTILNLFKTSEPDLSKKGFINYSCIVSTNEQQLKNFVEKYVYKNQQTNVCISYSFKLLAAGYLELIISIEFDKENLENVSQAQKLIKKFITSLYKEGILPYRLGVNYMSFLKNKNCSYRKIVKEIKILFDPNNIIAPKRYNI